MTRLTAAVLCVSILTGCASDKRLVQDAAASYTYFEWKYERDCLGDYAPVNCKARYAALKDLKGESTICNEAQKIGHLPKAARVNLKKATDGLADASR